MDFSYVWSEADLLDNCQLHNENLLALFPFWLGDIPHPVPNMPCFILNVWENISEGAVYLVGKPKNFL